MDIPDKDELPFYDPDKHSTMTSKEKRERAEAYRKYRENLKAASQDDQD